MVVANECRRCRKLELGAFFVDGLYALGNLNAVPHTKCNLANKEVYFALLAYGFLWFDIGWPVLPAGPDQLAYVDNGITCAVASEQAGTSRLPALHTRYTVLTV